MVRRKKKSKKVKNSLIVFGIIAVALIFFAVVQFVYNNYDKNDLVVTLITGKNDPSNSFYYSSKFWDGSHNEGIWITFEGVIHAPDNSFDVTLAPHPDFQNFDRYFSGTATVYTYLEAYNQETENWDRVLEHNITIADADDDINEVSYNIWADLDSYSEGYVLVNSFIPAPSTLTEFYLCDSMDRQYELPDSGDNVTELCVLDGIAFDTMRNTENGNTPSDNYPTVYTAFNLRKVDLGEEYLDPNFDVWVKYNFKSVYASGVIADIGQISLYEYQNLTIVTPPSSGGGGSSTPVVEEEVVIVEEEIEPEEFSITGAVIGTKDVVVDNWKESVAIGLVLGIILLFTAFKMGWLKK